MRPRIAILNLGAANFASVRFSLERCGAQVAIADSARGLADADAFVLPGVANFAHVAQSLDTRDLRAPLLRAIDTNIPILAICAGYQLLYEGSEEAPQAR